MGRHAGIPVGSLVVLAAVLAGACTRTWILSDNSDDGGPPPDAITGETGGALGKGGAAGFGGRGGSLGTGGQPAPACSPTQDKIGVQILTTDLIFIVDRTMSMGTKVGDTTRMGAVQTVLRTLIQSKQNEVNFGYAEFPGTGPCPNACCISFNSVATQPANYLAIDGAMQCDFGPSCLAQNDARPMAQTLMAVPGLWGNNQPYDPTVVLIVDGPPGCSFDDPSQTCQPALDAVSMLNGSATETYVVALGEDAQSETCLQKMAARGGTQMGLIPVSENGPDLTAALGEKIGPIVASAAETSCTIELKSKPPRMDQVSVFIKGTEVCHDFSTKNGWTWADQKSVRIQLRGPACQMLQNARQPDVWVRFGCAPCGDI